MHSCLHVLLWVVRTCIASEELEKCANEYGTHFEEHVSVSGAQIIILKNADEAWVASRFQLADIQVFGCWDLGGRYWEIKMSTQMYRSSLRVFGSSSHAASVEEFFSRLSLLPDLLMGGLCAPSSCGAEDIRTRVLPRYLSRILLVQDVPAPDAKDLDVRELSHWSALLLDFVVAGVDRCGTTSLLMNLIQNPDIDFTKPDEDQFFLENHEKVLPYLSEVEQHNQIWRARDPGHENIHGLDESTLFRYARVRHALARIPDLRVIAIVCDPLSRFEKLFWSQFYCPAAHLFGRVQPQMCWNSISVALEKPSLVAEWDAGESLRSLVNMFGPRLRLVHQEWLRSYPSETYNGLAKFLGATAFPLGTHFGRHNSARGHRTDLCKNLTLLAALKNFFAPQYAALEDLLATVGVEVPSELRHRTSRCDRPEEIVDD